MIKKHIKTIIAKKELQNPILNVPLILMMKFASMIVLVVFPEVLGQCVAVRVS